MTISAETFWRIRKAAQRKARHCEGMEGDVVVIVVVVVD